MGAQLWQGIRGLAVYAVREVRRLKGAISAKEKAGGFEWSRDFPGKLKSSFPVVGKLSSGFRGTGKLHSFDRSGDFSSVGRSNSSCQPPYSQSRAKRANESDRHASTGGGPKK